MRPLTVIASHAPVPGEYGLTLEELIARPAWHAQAACRGRGPGEWFPPRDGEAHPSVVAVCEACPVVEECYAAGRSEKGVWGGTSERQRADARRRRARAGRVA